MSEKLKPVGMIVETEDGLKKLRWATCNFESLPEDGVKLYAIPDDHVLVPVEYVEQAASDNNHRSVNWRKSTMKIFTMILQKYNARKK